MKSKNEGPLAVQTDVNSKIQNPDINENTKCSTTDKIESPELKHRKRITVSNWHRYEIDETQDEDHVQVADFNALLELSSLFGFCFICKKLRILIRIRICS